MTPVSPRKRSLGEIIRQPRKIGSAKQQPEPNRRLPLTATLRSNVVLVREISLYAGVGKAVAVRLVYEMNRLRSTPVGKRSQDG